MISLDTALERLSAHIPVSAEDAGVRAVVAIAVETDGDTPTFVLTLRTGTLRKHASQYALPGGKVDPGETLEEALMRELEEELGDRAWRIVGQLDDYVTQSGFLITPFVVLHQQGRAEIIVGEDEIAEIYRIPIDGDYRLYEVGTHVLAEGCTQCSLHGHDLFAPTGAIIYQFLELWATGNAPSLTQFREPSFAKR